MFVAKLPGSTYATQATNAGPRMLIAPRSRPRDLACWSWLTDGATPYVTFYEGNAIGVELPAAVEVAVAETEPGVKGDRVSGATKPAMVETGAVVQVPLFVETGDRIKVDTRTGAYLTRVQ